MREYRFLSPQGFVEMFPHVRDYLPDAFRDVNALAQIYRANTSAFFELGAMEGVLWFSNIAVGWKATAHLVLWGPRLFDRSDDARATLLDLMDLLQLQKVEAYLPGTNTAIIRYVEKIGFTKEGVLRQWERYDGRPVDILVYSFLKEN